MSKNDITGDRLVSKTSTEAYRDGHDRIFGKPMTLEEAIVEVKKHCQDRDEVIKKSPELRAIYYWPDGTWCDLEDYPSYTHKSDDVARVYLSFDYTDEQVQRLVDAACSRG